LTKIKKDVRCACDLPPAAVCVELGATERARTASLRLLEMDYLLLKLTHVTCVVLSYAGFVLRGIWMIRDSRMLERRWVRVLPHVVDTVLLASAIALAVVLKQYPFVEPWLTAKLVALLFYIGLGMVALRFGTTRSIRTGAWITAQAVFLYIVAVALTRNPAVLL
jgi:uncharacterized membrane protein SirB2